MADHQIMSGNRGSTGACGRTEGVLSTLSLSSYSDVCERRSFQLRKALISTMIKRELPREGGKPVVSLRTCAMDTLSEISNKPAQELLDAACPG